LEADLAAEVSLDLASSDLVARAALFVSASADPK
jgi:hypothetical protein